MIVVETLRYQHEVGDAEVDGQSNDGRHETSPDGTWKESEHVTRERQRRKRHQSV